MEYEILYLIGESKESNLEKIKLSVEKIISKSGGKFIQGEWTKQQKLAYPIQHEKRGTYIARRFTLPDKDEREIDEKKSGKNIIEEITRKLNLQEDVLRFIIVKTEELPPLETSANQLNKKLVEKRRVTDDKKKELIEKETNSTSEEKELKKIKKIVSEKNVRDLKEDETETKREDKDKQEQIGTKKSEAKTKTTKSEKNEIDKKLEEILNI